MNNIDRKLLTNIAVVAAFVAVVAFGFYLWSL